MKKTSISKKVKEYNDKDLERNRERREELRGWFEKNYKEEAGSLIMKLVKHNLLPVEMIENDTNP